MISASEKVRARRKLRTAVAAGLVTPQACENCLAAPAQAHHPDYAVPLDVRWLCAACHSQLHNQKHPLTKACVVCGAEFTPSPTKRARAKTCSPACRVSAISRSMAANPEPTRPVWTKLTLEKAAEIRRRRAEDGAPTKVLIQEFGVTRATINSILRGAIWADAPCVGSIMADAAPRKREDPKPIVVRGEAA